MEKKSEILRIVVEDILRLLAEEGKKATSEQINQEAKASQPFILEAIDTLIENKLISSDKGLFYLTPKGEDAAENILEKHLFLERYFKDTKGKKKAHEISHIFEHYISKEVLDNLKKLSTFKGMGSSLSGLKGDSGFITDIDLETKQFERIISMGVFPGEKIRVLAKLPNGLVFKVENKKIFASWEIAKGIKVLGYAEA